jgi:hypothetical protein
MTEQRFYLIEVNYVGPHPSQKGHRASMVEIRPEPGRKNMSGEPCERGWLGTTDDWHRQAVGVYNEQGARKMLTETYGIKLPEASPVKYEKYCHSHRHAEWYNRRWCY